MNWGRLDWGSLAAMIGAVLGSAAAVLEAVLVGITVSGLFDMLVLT